MRRHILNTLLHSTTHFGDHFFYFHKEFTTIRTIQPAINLGLKFSYIYEEQSVIIVVTLYFLRDRINRKCLRALQVWVCLCAVSEYVRRITWHIIFVTNCTALKIVTFPMIGLYMYIWLEEISSWTNVKYKMSVRRNSKCRCVEKERPLKDDMRQGSMIFDHPAHV